MSRKLRIIVSGMIAGVPYQGGAAWAVLQYLLGFKRLGHEVSFVEPVDESSLQPRGASLSGSVNAAFFRRVLKEFGMEGNASLVIHRTRQTVGLDYARLREEAEHADILVNISGMLDDEELTQHIPLRVYLDLDPAFNQLWHSTQAIDMHLAGHTHFATVGLAVGQADCRVPTCGVDWITTLPPVVLEQWPVAQTITYDALTTVANWRGYGSIEHGGVFYGQKVHSLRQFMELPTRTTERFSLALAIHPDETRDLAALAANGWKLLDPAKVAPTPSQYRGFLQASKGEFGIAKSGYVNSNSGWFSDRSACYLASGRPVLAQETGFSRFLPIGEGLLAFENLESAVEEIQEVNRDYARHCRAARELAEEFLDSDEVLSRLLSCIGATQ